MWGDGVGSQRPGLRCSQGYQKQSRHRKCLLEIGVVRADPHLHVPVLEISWREIYLFIYFLFN